MKRISLIISSIIAASFLVVILCLIFRTEKSKELTIYGNVDVRQVDISFRVSGRIEKLSYEEGDFVSAGCLLAVLDKTPYDSQIMQAKSNIASIKASLENAEALLKRRVQAVSVGGVSRQDVDDALASKNELMGSLHAAEASLAIAVDNMNYTEVYAPTDGIILSRIREPGTVVNPSDPVYTLSVSSPVWIRAYIDEPRLGLIHYGMEAEIMTDSGKSYIGQVGFISPVAEFTPKTVETAQLRTDLVYRLRIYAKNPDRYLKQGMPITVKLRRGA